MAVGSKRSKNKGEGDDSQSIDDAGDSGPSAKKRGTDNTMQEPMPKTKAGMINAMYGKMNGMKKDQLTAMYSKMQEEFEDMVRCLAGAD